MSKPRYVVISTMKNEAPYIVDWVAHQLLLGFEYIIIATNDCEDTTVPLIERLGAVTGKIKRHQTIIRKAGLQRSAIRQCSYRYQEAVEAEWNFICDIDEYLNIKVGDGKVEDLLAAASPDASCITVPWRMYASTESPYFNDEPITTLSFECEPISGKGVSRANTGAFCKSIYRPSEMIARPGIHGPIVHKEFRDQYKSEYPGALSRQGDMDTVFQNRLASFNIAQINHYSVRSLEGYLVKINRGRPNHVHDVLGLSYWKKNNLRGAVDRSIERYNEEFLKIRAELLSDEQVFDLHAQGVDWHLNKINKMRKLPELQEFIRLVENNS